MSSRALERQKKSFDSLVGSGVYGVGFEHAPGAKRFVAQVLRDILPRLQHRPRPAVLDCGCGTGAWLAFLRQELFCHGLADVRLCGFDLSPRMVEVAREKLRNLAAPDDIRTGNLLERKCYGFTGLSRGFDLVFTYDVVQQLPRAVQAEACRRMVAALSPCGVALIFDNDADSRFGRRMALRKLVTRYCGLPLVPHYYCNAAYPFLGRIRSELAEAALATEIIVRPDLVKRALVVKVRDGAGPTREVAQAERRIP